MKRKNIAILLISVIVLGLMPTTVSAASENKISKTVTLEPGTAPKIGEEPSLNIKIQDALTTGQAFNLNLDGAQWLEFNKEDTDSLINYFPEGEAAQQIIDGEKVDGKFNFISRDPASEKSYIFEASRENDVTLAIKLLDEDVEGVNLAEVRENNIKSISIKDFDFKFPIAAKVMGQEAYVEVERRDTSLSNSKHVFAVTWIKGQDKAEIIIGNKDLPQFYLKGTILPIAIEERFGGHFSAKDFWGTEEKRTIKVKLLNPDFEFNLSGSEKIAFKRAFGGRRDIEAQANYFKNSDGTEDRKIIEIILPEAHGREANERGSLELKGFMISAVVPSPKDGKVQVLVDGANVSETQGTVAVIKNTAQPTTPPSGGTSSGSSSSSTSSPTTTTTTSSRDDDITVTSPTQAGQSNLITQTSVAVKPTVTKNTANVSVSQNAVENAIKKAQETLEKSGSKDNGIQVEIKVDNEDKAVSNISAELPKASIDALAKAGITQLSINSAVGTIALDLETLKTIQDEIKGDVNVSANKVDNNTLSEATKAVIGDRPVFNFAITGISGQKVTNFGKGKVSIAIPYTLAANEKAEDLLVYYIDDKDVLYEMPNTEYDLGTGLLSFDTDHFSKFAVGYQEVQEIEDTEPVELEKEEIVFTDIENHWAKKDIEFVTTRGLFGGTAEGVFSPNLSMTRGMLVTVLARLDKADLSSYQTSSFADVTSDAYYMPAIEWARKQGIVNGLSATDFGPNQAISREQLAVIIANYAKITGFELTNNKVSNEFADHAKISSYAKASVNEMYLAGLISGREDNTFDPQGTATRAEVSAVLKRFVQLIE